MENPSEQPSETQNQDVVVDLTENKDNPTETQNADTTESKSPPTQKNKRDKTRSFVWDHFKKLDNDRTECKYCKKTYAANTKLNGTSSMKTHLEVQCKSYPYRILDKKQKTLSWEASSNLKAIAYDAEECRKEVARMVIIDELPFRHVEAEGFKRLCYRLEPIFTVPSRMTVAGDVMKIYVEEKGNLKKNLNSQRVCLTTDTWTSIQNINYMCVTAHWIDEDWNIQKRIIIFFQVPDHKGETIGKFIEKCLLDWCIEIFLTIIVDNASSNDGAIRYLKRRTKDRKETILSHDFLHIRCSAHILNLIVKEGLNDQFGSILRIRNVVRYVRSSPARMKSFKKCVELEKIESRSLLCLDVETRWNSTYLLLESAIKFQKAFDRFWEDDGNFRDYFRNNGGDSKYVGPPDDNDWEEVIHLIKFLKMFYDATLQFSGSLYVTSDTFFGELVKLQTKLKNLMNKDDEKLRSMATKMKAKFSKYWENVDNLNFLVYVASVLDPRNKMRYVEFCFTQVYDNNNSLARKMIERVESTLSSLYNQYLDKGGVRASTSSPIETTNEMDDEDGDLEFQFMKKMQEEASVENKSELARYLAENCVERTKAPFDILAWWKVNSPRYPILSQVARDILAIPVSTVASESAFSTSGRILDPFRSSLSPIMVEALICTQNWIQKISPVIDLREVMDDLGKYDNITTEFKCLTPGLDDE